MSNGYIYSIYKSKNNNNLALGIFDEKLFYWYDNASNNLMDLWVNEEMIFICYSNYNSNNNNLFNIIVDMKNKKVIKNNIELNYEDIKNKVYEKTNMWDFNDYDADEEEYETYDDDPEVEKQNIKRMDKLECFSSEFLKKKCDDAEIKLQYLNKLYINGSNKEYYHKKIINQLCRKLKNTENNFKHIRYNFILKDISYSEGDTFQYEKYFRLNAQLNDIYAKFRYERTEGDEKSGYDINKWFDCDFLDKDITKLLYSFLNKRINWKLFLYKCSSNIDFDTECPIIDD